MLVPVWMVGAAFLGGVVVTLAIFVLVKVFAWLGVHEDQFYT